MIRRIIPVGRSIVFDTPWIKIEAVDVVPDNAGDDELAAGRYYRVVDAPGVICVLFSSTGDFVMVRQPRPVVEKYTLEFPAGRVDPGETPEEAVRREVFEETGLKLAYLHLLGQTEPVPSRLHALQSLFIGVTAPGAPMPVKDGGSEMVLVPRDQFQQTMEREGMNCLVALGALKLAELLWSVDLFKASIDVICQQFGAHHSGAYKV